VKQELGKALKKTMKRKKKSKKIAEEIQINEFSEDTLKNHKWTKSDRNIEVNFKDFGKADRKVPNQDRDYNYFDWSIVEKEGETYLKKSICGT